VLDILHEAAEFFEKNLLALFELLADIK